MTGARGTAAHFLDVDIDLLTTIELDAALEDAAERERQIVVANHNLHSLYLHRKLPALRAFYDSADLVHIDGMPVVWIARMLGVDARREHRTTYVDWLPQIASLAARHGWRVFYLGSRAGVAQRGLELLSARFPGFEWRAVHGYLDLDDPDATTESVIAAIDAFRPHILLVGMGMPRQELWIANNRDRLTANVILPCGAAIDYVAGVVPTPPRWLASLGGEWLFRLAAEPRRLAHRYLGEPWALVGPLLRALVRRAIGRAADAREL